MPEQSYINNHNSPDYRGRYPGFHSAGQRMEVKNSIAVLNRPQCEAKDPVHQVKRVTFDVECAIRRIRVKQVVVDPPGS